MSITGAYPQLIQSSSYLHNLILQDEFLGKFILQVCYFVFRPPSALPYSAPLLLSFYELGHCEHGIRRVEGRNNFAPNLPVQRMCWKCSPCAHKHALQWKNMLWFTHYSSAGEILVLTLWIFSSLHVMSGDFFCTIYRSGYFTNKNHISSH
jgi:hypothetical protein